MNPALQDLSVFSNDDSEWNSAQGIVDFCDLAVCIEQDGDAQFGLADEVFDRAFVFLNVDGIEVDALGFEILIDCVEAWKRRDARAAPGGPEVEDVDGAFEALVGDELAIEAGQCECGRGFVFEIGAHVSGGVGLRAGRGRPGKSVGGSGGGGGVDVVRRQQRGFNDFCALGLGEFCLVGEHPAEEMGAGVNDERRRPCRGRRLRTRGRRVVRLDVFGTTGLALRGGWPRGQWREPERGEILLAEEIGEVLAERVEMDRALGGVEDVVAILRGEEDVEFVAGVSGDRVAVSHFTSEEAGRGIESGEFTAVRGVDAVDVEIGFERAGD